MEIFEELNLSNYSILLLLYIIEYKHSIIELYPEAHWKLTEHRTGMK